MKLKVFAALLLLLKLDDLLSMTNWGRWHPGGPQLVGIINAQQELVVQQGLVGRNLLLSDQGVMYINNMYPIMECDNKKQLGNILVSKSIITQQDLNYVCANPALGESPVPHWEALGQFMQGVVRYLEAFGADVGVVQNVYDNYLAPGKTRNYQNLNAAKAALQDGNNMRVVWEYMHTEFLYVFDSFFNTAQQGIVLPFLSFKIVSHYDMCEKCESLMLYMGQWVNEKNYKNESYSILIGSFFPYKDSRSRNGTAKLLKVVLQSNTFVGIKASAPEGSRCHFFFG
jgi:hypothetical protein